jgi:YbaB/EbfC DNA-binding family
MSDEPDDATHGALGDPAALGDLGGLLESAQQALSAQAAAAAEIVEGRSVRLAPEVVDPADVGMLEDLIVAALHDAGSKVAELQHRALGAFGGIDLGGIGDILGGSGPR